MLTPVLAGRVVNAIVAGGEVSAAADTVLGLAAGIAGLAGLEAVVGLASRWFSARIGEGLIVDLRRAVSSTCNACRSRSSPAPGPGRWSAG